MLRVISEKGAENPTFSPFELTTVRAHPPGFTVERYQLHKMQSTP